MGELNSCLGLVLDLCQESLADVARANNADTQREGSQIEAAVDSSECSDGVLLVYKHGDVVFTAALSYAPASKHSILANLYFRCSWRKVWSDMHCFLQRLEQVDSAGLEQYRQGSNGTNVLEMQIVHCICPKLCKGHSCFLVSGRRT